jgi:hypothetical protein
MGSKSSTFTIAMAESRIIRNLSRPTAADSDGVFAIELLGRIGDFALLDNANACSILLLKVAGFALMLVRCVCGGDFMMVVDKGYESGGSSLHSVV